MLSSNTFSLSTGNAPNLKQLDHITPCSVGVKAPTLSRAIPDEIVKAHLTETDFHFQHSPETETRFRFPIRAPSNSEPPRVAVDVSLSDNSVEAFPVVVSAMEETMQTTDPDQPLTEQSSSRLTPISILTADTIGALRSRKILKVLFDPGSTYTFINKKGTASRMQAIPNKESQED